ncbi:MAG: methylmalonyl Co-A mutase-associated GTPase MeaB [Pseudomonadota bacterium]
MPTVDEIRNGSVLAIARLICDVDDGDPAADTILRKLFPHTGKSRILGITGLPGAGKSTLISHLITYYRKAGLEVGVISIDPTSPFSGGAILGDRIRMQEHNADPGVFIKSVGTRGGSGGLSRSVCDIVRVFEAAGKEIVLIETVGVGQDEVDIFKIVQQVLVVMAPGLGDDIQAIKAGVLEIADIFVVNKCDLPGADRTAREMAEAGDDHVAGTSKPVLLTDAIHNQGIAELMKQVEDGFRKFDDPMVSAKYRTRRCRYEIEMKVRDRLLEKLREEFKENAGLAAILTKVADGKTDPYTAVDEIVKRYTVR